MYAGEGPSGGGGILPVAVCSLNKRQGRPFQSGGVGCGFSSLPRVGVCVGAMSGALHWAV